MMHLDGFTRSPNICGNAIPPPTVPQTPRPRITEVRKTSGRTVFFRLFDDGTSWPPFAALQRRPELPVDEDRLSHLCRLTSFGGGRQATVIGGPPWLWKPPKTTFIFDRHVQSLNRRSPTLPSRLSDITQTLKQRAAPSRSVVTDGIGPHLQWDISHVKSMAFRPGLRALCIPATGGSLRTELSTTAMATIGYLMGFETR